VDIGEVVTVGFDHLYPITLDILRIPKLAIPCKLAYVYPDSGEWPLDIDVSYVRDYSGSSQIVYFNNFCSETQSFGVTVEVNGVNMALKYFHVEFGGVEQVNLPLVDIRANGKVNLGHFSLVSIMMMG